LREAAGAREKRVELPSEISTGAALIDWLCAGDSDLRIALSRPSVRLCVDQAIISNDAAFDHPQEIAFLPAFSGG